MTETERPSPARDDWELIELIERREDFEKLLAVSRRAAGLNPKLKKDFQAVIEERRLYEILKVERGPGKVRLTLANSWRLSRYENRPGLFPEAFDPAAVTLQAFDLADGDWKEQALGEIYWEHCLEPWGDNFSWRTIEDYSIIWPNLVLRYHPGVDSLAYYSLLRGLALKILIGFADDLTRAYLNGYEPDVAAHVFASRYSELPYKQTARAIEGILHRYILDEDVLSLTRLIYGNKEICLSHYLAAAAKRKHLARLARETPAFMPVVDLIPCDWWARRDLLRDKILRVTNPAFQYLSGAGLRWLRRTPAKILRALGRKFYADANRKYYRWAAFVIEVMAELSPWPGGAYWESCQAEVIDGAMRLGYRFSREEENKVGVDPVSARRLVRILARHILNLAAEQRRQRPEYKKYYGVGDYDDEGHIVDWYMAEGRRRGLPDKNSTWSSLARRAEKWHEEISQREMMAEAENAAWESLVGPMEIEGIKIKPLVTGLDLYNEGREMKHCVVSYAPRCANEGRRIFSLTEPDGRRSTLSLRPREEAFAIDQHKGPANGPVSPAAARAAREICRLYTRAAEAQDAFGMAEPPHSPEEAKPAATEGAAK